jgi:hypothetical protein
MYGIYKGVNEYCRDDEVVVVVDGDDALVGRFVFALIHKIYTQNDVAVVYSQHLKV